MDDIGNIGYILFFVFILIVNAIASANKRRQKQQRQQQQRERQQQNRPEAETGERTKSLEEVMRELFGDTRPTRQPEAQPERKPTPPETRELVTDEDAEAVKQVVERQRRYANPLQEVMEATMNDQKRIAQRKADQEQLQKIFAQREEREDSAHRHYHIHPRNAVIYSEILLKPRWKEF